MAAPSTSLSRLGQVNASGSDDALFLKQFGGEILTEYAKNCVFKERHFVRQISNGKSAQFPMIGSVSSAYHTPGDWIDGGSANHAEMVLTVDGLLISKLFIAQIDELMNHYDVRGPYATELGRELAKQYDQNVARMGVLAARTTTNPLTGRAGGETITTAGMDTTASVISAALFSAAQKFDEKFVPEGDRACFMRPAQFYICAADTDLINKDWGGKGEISRGSFESLAGIEIVKTNHLPGADDSANTAIKAAYRANYANTMGLVMNRMAVGTVQLMDISLESAWEIRTQGTFMIAKMAVGHGKLRVECAIELADSD
jgi:hypothetical protein